MLSESNDTSSENEIQADDVQSETSDVENKGRKRLKNETKWKRNIRKSLRNSGKQYISSRGKIIPAKQYKDVQCLCIGKCHNLLTFDQKKKIFDSYYSLGSHDLQTSYLCSLINIMKKKRSYVKNSSNSRKEFSRIYYLPLETGITIKVCKDFFKKSFNISDGRITRALVGKLEGTTPPKDRRGRGNAVNKIPIDKISEVREFIKKFPTSTSHYSRNDNMNKNYLSPNLNISIMYNLYKQENNEPVSMFTFRKTFNRDFNLSFHPPVSDSCKRCDMYKNQIKVAPENEKKQLNAEHELHLRKAESARNGMNNDVELGKTDPNKVTVIAFDLMKTLSTPSLSVGMAYYKRQLSTYNLGIHNLTTNDAYMYVWNESMASRGPQEIGSCLLHFIKNYVHTEQLIMYSDQCGGQNRNIKMALICNFVVNSNDYLPTEIHHKFLVSGHSYLACDRDFGVIEKEKRYHPEIYVPNDWIKVIESARKKNLFKVIQMRQEDFKSTVLLEKDITNRKINADGEKVEWMKIQWLYFVKDKPYKMFFKYSNNEFVAFISVNFSKRLMVKPKELEQLYPNGLAISNEKYNDLMELLQFIPPIHHEFYKNLKKK